MENLIRLVFCGHVLVWYLARVHLRLEFLVVRYLLEWFPQNYEVKYDGLNNDLGPVRETVKNGLGGKFRNYSL